jgi:Tfp pilus assembly protein PilO
MTATRKWSLIAAVLVVAIVAAGWSLLIAPKRSEAAGLRADAVARDTANAALVQKLEILKAQQADLPSKRARLATLARLIPDNPALPALVRGMTTAGNKAGVTVVSLEPEVPTPLVETLAPVAVAPADPSTSESSDTASSDTASSDTASTAPAAPVAPPAPSLYQVPLKVVVTGNYFELEQFVDQVERSKRAFQVTGFTLEPPPGTTEPDVLQLTLDSRVFLSPAQAKATATSVSASGVTAPAGQ